MLKEAKPQVSRKLPDTLDMLAKYVWDIQTVYMYLFYIFVMYILYLVQCLDIDQVMPDIQASLTSVVLE